MANSISEDAKKDAIKMFQKVANLPVTGVMDANTKAEMKKERCGMKDTDAIKKIEAASLGLANFELRPKWRKNKLTYHIREYPKNKKTAITKEQLDVKVREAFKMWSDVANIDFEETAPDLT